jgi:hypothetical protein
MGHNYAVSGLEIGGVINITSTDFKGVQLSGAANYVRDDFFGYQAATGNIVEDVMTGAQQGVVNYAGTLNGIQNGVFNFTLGHTNGLQGGTANYSDSIRGAQIGVVNVADFVSGMQAGVVNISSYINGFQFGVVNIAEENDGFPLGLVTIVGSYGQTHVQTWYDSRGFYNFSFLHGTRKYYNIYSAGYQTGKQQYLLSLGLGMLMQYKKFFANAELAAGNITSLENRDEVPDFTVQARLYGGYSISRHFSLMGGGLFYWDDASASVKSGIFAGLRF